MRKGAWFTFPYIGRELEGAQCVEEASSPPALEISEVLQCGFTGPFTHLHWKHWWLKSCLRLWKGDGKQEGKLIFLVEQKTTDATKYSCPLAS